MQSKNIVETIFGFEQKQRKTALELLFDANDNQASQAKVNEIDDDLMKNIVLNGDIEDIKSLNEYLKAKNNLERRALPIKNNIEEVKELTGLMQSKLSRNES